MSEDLEMPDRELDQRLHNGHLRRHFPIHARKETTIRPAPIVDKIDATKTTPPCVTCLQTRAKAAKLVSMGNRNRGPS